jgi:hypothetical protein
MPEGNVEGESTAFAKRVENQGKGASDFTASNALPHTFRPLFRAADVHVGPWGSAYWRSALRDIIAGTLGGIAGKLIEFPFDTVKVRLQAGGSNGFPSYAGPMDCFRKILQHEGVRTLYRGMSLPLAGTVVETATLFSANGYLKRKLSEAGQIAKGDNLPMSYVLASGAGTGFVVSFVLTPIELVKCRLQVQSASAPGAGNGAYTYRGPIDCLLRSIREEGLSVVYRGHLGTMLREIPGTACWFGAYETFLRSMTPPGKRREDLSSLIVVTAGALGGMAYWAVMYPADTIKSSMQIAHTSNGSEAGEAAAAAARSSSAADSSVSNSNKASLSGRPAVAQRLPVGAGAGAAASAPSAGPSAGHVASYSTSAVLRSGSSAVPASSGAHSHSHSPISFTGTAAHIYKTRGLAGLYAGLTPTMIRAAPSNAIIFLVYEWSAQAIGKWLDIDDV